MQYHMSNAKIIDSLITYSGSMGKITKPCLFLIARGFRTRVVPSSGKDNFAEGETSWIYKAV
jgi:hypothetical protein